LRVKDSGFAWKFEQLDPAMPPMAASSHISFRIARDQRDARAATAAAGLASAEGKTAEGKALGISMRSHPSRRAQKRAPQDEDPNPHGEERGNAARLEP